MEVRNMFRLAPRKGIAVVLCLLAAPSLQAATADGQLAAIDDAAVRAWDQGVELTSCDEWAEPVCGCAECIDCGEAACGAAVATPVFGGPCCTRSKLAGDWLGSRTALADGGLTLDADNTSFYFGNASGGLRRDFEYGGHGDYIFNIDSGKMGLVPGQFWKIRAEHNFGNTINGYTGALVPVTVLPATPVRDSEHLYLTNVILTQALSESFVLFAGKMDTLDGDPNAFASGRGKTQFSNMAMVANLAPLVMFPYSSLGAGFSVLHELQPVWTVTAINSTDTTRTSGFDELFNDGVTLINLLRLPTEFFGLPGHQLFGATWSSKNFVALGQDPRVILPDVPIERQDDSWSVFWNCDQHLIVNPSNPTQGWGYFARAGMADENTSAIEYFLSAGLGGSSPLASRPGDTWGVGWYHIGVSDEIGPIIETAFGPISDGDGVEIFYNAAVTPWCHITPDMQIIMPGRDVVDESLVVGVRANIDL
jgi:porin